MARVYISSTFRDLKDIRARVANALRLFGHEIVAMETYVAEDARPLDVVLRDVGSSDIYVGIFAFRYGFIPRDAINTDKLSITELELEHARASNVPRLIFVLREGAPWPTNQLDSQDPDGDKGERIKALRERLLEDRLASQFNDAAELETLVSAAVTKAVGGASPVQPVPHVRQIRTQVLLLHCPGDQPLAQAWTAALASRGLSVSLDGRLLLAQTAQDVLALDRLLVSHHAVVLLVTPGSARLMATNAAIARRSLGMASARTGGLIASLHNASLPPELPATAFVPVQAIQPTGVGDADLDALVRTIHASCPLLGERAVVGLPFTIVAMTRGETDALASDPDRATAELPRKYEKHFTDLWTSLQTPPDTWQTRHGADRSDWRPLGGALTAGEMLREAVDNLNARVGGPLGERRIRLQYYPIDALVEPQDALLGPVYAALERLGCLAIVDELSLFHWKLRGLASTFLSAPQVSVITVAPTMPMRDQIEELLEAAARQQLATSYVRFDRDCDPQYEFGVEGVRQLRRSLHRTMPDTLQRIREPAADPDKRSAFRAEVRTPSRNIGGALFPGLDG